MKAPMTTLAIMTAALIAWTTMPVGVALAQSWSGRATANVNLRAAPGLQGAVITGLVQGTVLEVQEEKDGWIKVAHQNDGFGYQGWVYSRYVQKVDAAGPLTAPATEERGSQTQVEAATVPPPTLVPTKARTVLATPAAPAVPLPAASPASLAIAENTAAAQENRTLSPPSVVKPTPPPVQASDRSLNDGRDQDILFTKRSTVPENATAIGAPASPGIGALSWLSLLLRLSTVLLAALALLTANRALQTAREASCGLGRI